MRKSIPALLLLGVSLGGCSLFSGRVAAPDEFAVTRNAPLIIPPDYSLVPPVAGATSATPADAQQQAIDALFGGPAPRSAGEMAVLDAAGRDRVEMGIRSTAWDPDTRIVDKGRTTLAILQAPQSDGQVATAQVP